MLYIIYNYIIYYVYYCIYYICDIYIICYFGPTMICYSHSSIHSLNKYLLRTIYLVHILSLPSQIKNY